MAVGGATTVGHRRQTCAWSVVRKFQVASKYAGGSRGVWAGSLVVSGSYPFYSCLVIVDVGAHNWPWCRPVSNR